MRRVQTVVGVPCAPLSASCIAPKMDEIPADELRTILEKRCLLPASFCTRMVDVMLELQRRRRSSNVFQVMRAAFSQVHTVSR